MDTAAIALQHNLLFYIATEVSEGACVVCRAFFQIVRWLKKESGGFATELLVLATGSRLADATAC